jgi:EAL domain-containing protein (putative c-di-GMP-specific phosphodiesterase class I)
MRTDTREKKALKQAALRFLVIPILLCVFACIRTSYNAFESRRQELYRQQQEQVVTAMLHYRNYVSYITSIVRRLEADTVDILLEHGNGQTAEALFTETILTYPDFSALRILTPEGMEALHVTQAEGAANTVPDSALADQASAAYYLETAALERHQYLFSGLEMAAEAGKVAASFLRISVPLEADGRRMGYFIADIAMEPYLETLRLSLLQEGCQILVMNERGVLYTQGADIVNAEPLQAAQTASALFPALDFSADNGSFTQAGMLCSYLSFHNLYDRGLDYYLSANAASKDIFLVCYDSRSVYAKDLHYSFFYHTARSWAVQLGTCAFIFLLYFVVLRWIFLYDRLRFTDLFSDNRYPKSILRQALKKREFEIYYQPIVNIQTGTVMGFEALSRWNYHGQLLPPSMFIDEVLHYQLGQALDESVFLQVRKDRKRMEQVAGFHDTFISINCCQQTFNSLIQEPPATVIRLTEEEKPYIVLELLENIVFNQNTQERIREMYKHNILFAIDDFGTGNSNIAFIRSFENLKVKIDRTFVPVDPTNHKERIILEAFVKMFVDQGLKLIIEGVESREQIEYLKTLGIAGVQGYYFSHPMPIDRLMEFIGKEEYKKKL